MRRQVNVREIQTRTSPFGHYATHEPCGAVLTPVYSPDAPAAYALALDVLQRGHVCQVER